MSVEQEPEIVVHTREQLIFLLDEAAEIEHGLMCCYLYALWSLKNAEEGLTAEQAEAVGRWKGLIRGVAVDEMLHLAVVSNLLMAVGGHPHLHRQNFPVAPGYHPGDIVVKLAPFDKATLDHFVFLERPEGMDLPDGEGFAHATYRRAMRKDLWMPTAQDYLTVGHFYRSLSAAFAYLADKLGPDTLFCGDPARQLRPGILEWEGLGPVHDVQSAQAAIETVVRQGEGTPGDVEDSHYWRFLAVRDELASLTAADPSFAPAWPCATNPVQKTPPRPEDRVYVDHPVSSRVLDLGNATYNLMLRTLAFGFGGRDPAPARKVLVDCAIDGMYAVAALGRHLARLPASDHAHPGVHAGLSFAITRSYPVLPAEPSTWTVLIERHRELAGACAQEASLGEPVAEVAEQLRTIGAALEAARPA